MNTFAQALSEEGQGKNRAVVRWVVGGVPYTIIGDESFAGFSESSKMNYRSNCFLNIKQ